MKIRVICHEGYRAQETPRAFYLGERRLEVVSVHDRWRGEDHEYVKLSASDGYRYILRYDRNADLWEITLMEAPGGPAGLPDPRRGH
jgi:hypothetical protein